MLHFRFELAIHKQKLEIKNFKSERKWVNDFEELELSVIRYKFEEIEISSSTILDYQARSYDSNEYDKIISQKRLIDIILSQSKVDHSLGLTIYDRCSEILEISGYGDGSNNIALQVSLRRRWWILNLMYNTSINYDLLESDLIFWKNARMFNELREFVYSLIRNRVRISAEIIRRILYDILKAKSIFKRGYLSRIEKHII